MVILSPLLQPQGFEAISEGEKNYGKNLSEKVLIYKTFDFFFTREQKFIPEKP